MLKKIQKNLLIKHPLLWNLKIVPVALCLLAFNLIFFIVGIINGKIDFTETETNYSNSVDSTIIFFSVLISALSMVIWLVYYLKNNGLKSFYPQSQYALYKEWLLILIICFFNFTYIISYLYGKDTRVRSYYTESEATKRCEILSIGSYFVSGSYSQYYNDIDYDKVAVDTKTVVPVNSAEKDSITYKGVKYSFLSLINKNINSYSFFDQTSDSLRKEKIKTWLVDNKKDSILVALKKYLSIANDHRLPSNITANQWIALVYDYPKFVKYKEIGDEAYEIYYEYNNQYNKQKLDTSNQYIRKINENYYLFNKYYVPEKALYHSYNTIAESWTKPSADLDALLVTLLVALAFSLAIFSFRVTSARNWIIALVVSGIIGIVSGIISGVSNSELVFFGIVSTLILFLFIYFLVIIKNNKAKGFSGIALNMMLWLFPFFFPFLYAIVIKLSKKYSGYYGISDVALRAKQYPFIDFLDQYDLELLWCNIAFLFLMMLFFSFKIKKWRGIAEN